MKTLVLTATLALAILALTNFEGVHAGERCALCDARPGDTPCLPLVQITCDVDCATNHNATTGTCDDDYNCVCSGVQPDGPLKCQYPLNPIGLISGFCQCEVNDGGFLTSQFTSICDYDCQCNHGAANGTCIWGRKQCKCNYPTTGWAWTPATCQYAGEYDAAQKLQDLLIARILGLGR